MRFRSRPKRPDPMRMLSHISSEENVLTAISLVTAADMVARDGRAAVPIAYMLADMSDEEISRAAMVLACWICGFMHARGMTMEEWARDIRERMASP